MAKPPRELLEAKVLVATIARAEPLERHVALTALQTWLDAVSGRELFRRVVVGRLAVESFPSVIPQIAPYVSTLAGASLEELERMGLPREMFEVLRRWKD